MAAGGFVIVGDPDDCANGVQKWADEGFDQLTFSPTTNTLPTDVVVQSMELFGREVIPQFDKDPVHSTTRYREAASPVASARHRAHGPAARAPRRSPPRSPTGDAGATTTSSAPST